jgi:hypothetical protein
MKKLLFSLMAVAIAVFCLTGAAFAATGAGLDEGQKWMSENNFDSYYDTVTGLGFSYPDTWTLKVKKNWRVTASGQRISARAITLTSITGEHVIKFTQILNASNDANVRFLVNNNNETLSFISKAQSLMNIEDLFFKIPSTNLQKQDAIDAKFVLDTIYVQ